ncbi:MAG: hypothetical protein L6Q98_10385 [Anaerolineae bacterium]|nr:hypothetical protein [Anaerolineae bacterium]NUQ03208.1 hypothetical protein [Anaerolineae bacterium]
MMLKSVIRFFTALRRALALTARGETPRQAALRLCHPALAAWCLECIRRADMFLAAAQAAQVDLAALSVRVDGRGRLASVIVAGVRYHAQHEYPYLIGGADPHRWLTLQALNLNDRFAVSRMREALPPSLQPAADPLLDHLDGLPGETA